MHPRRRRKLEQLAAVGSRHRDRETAPTLQVLLLDGEQTVIGGLYTTQKTITRRGVPILKDLPLRFFGLRYLFGYSQFDSAYELLIIIQARLLDQPNVRTQRPFPDQLLERRRRQLEEDVRRLDASKARKVTYPDNN
ncbi:MAG: hypothetical protein R2834_04360 [Rhodothermales bacterium]